MSFTRRLCTEDVSTQDRGNGEQDREKEDRFQKGRGEVQKTGKSDLGDKHLLQQKQNQLTEIDAQKKGENGRKDRRE